MASMEETRKQKDSDDRDDAVMAADDTGMLETQHVVLEEEILEHTQPENAPRENDA